MHPQVERINTVNKMYKDGCKCVYKNNNYTKETLHLTQCTAFTTSTGEEVTDVLIHFGDEKLSEHVKVDVSDGKLILTDYE